MLAGGEADDAFVGQVLGERYRIDARLGDGGMGTVYRAHHLALQRDVAVKLLHTRLTRDAAVAKRFDREALASSKLDHPNCVRVLDAGSTEAGAKYLVMELLEGRELHVAGEGKLEPTRAVELVIQILRGLEHAHRRGLVHRDLKPENIFIVRDDDDREVIKIVDFGIVKLLTGDTSGEALTRVGLVFGTPRYMSPEQVAGGHIDERADLYAVGVLLHELLAGAPPFDADDAGMLLRMHLIADPPELPAEVPAPIREVVARLLQKSAKDRPASAREVREALERAVAPTVPPLPTTSPPLLPPSGVYRTVIAVAPAVPTTTTTTTTRKASPLLGLVVAVASMALVLGYVALRLRGCSATPTAASPAEPSPPVGAALPIVEADASTGGPSTPAADTGTPLEPPPAEGKREKKHGKKHKHGKGHGKHD